MRSKVPPWKNSIGNFSWMIKLEGVFARSTFKLKFFCVACKASGSMSRATQGVSHWSLRAANARIPGGTENQGPVCLLRFLHLNYFGRPTKSCPNTSVWFRGCPYQKPCLVQQ